MVTSEVDVEGALSFWRGFFGSGIIIGFVWVITISSSFSGSYWPPLVLAGLFLIVGHRAVSQWDERRLGLGLMTGALVGAMVSITLTWAGVDWMEERCAEENPNRAEFGCGTDEED